MLMGCSLSPAIITDRPVNQSQKTLLREYGGAKRMLSGLRQMQIDSVEVRNITAETPENTIRLIAETCGEADMSVTVHGALDFPCPDLSLFFKPYFVLAKYFNRINVTLHVLKDQTEETNAEILRSISANAAEFGLPICITAENNRSKCGFASGESCNSIARIIDSLDSNTIGACWDFGHYRYNRLMFSADADALPGLNFLRRVRHTHIHGLGGPDGLTTHYPLCETNVPLKEYCDALINAGYQGVFNLELDFPRFIDSISPRAGLEHSVFLLREVLHI